MGSKRYALFVGRWQNWHSGHEWLINRQLDSGKDIWVAIRDVEIDENNPKNAQEVLEMLNEHEFFKMNSNKILVSIIPDIESINYGRGVGYDVIYHEPPPEIAEISGTKIRKGEINATGKKTHS
jgi:phosphopantetheine adenylyltransferase